MENCSRKLPGRKLFQWVTSTAWVIGSLSNRLISWFLAGGDEIYRSRTTLSIDNVKFSFVLIGL